MKRLENRVGLVTGASRGIGKATALLLAREGASVCVNYFHSNKEADEVVQEITSELKARAIAIKANVGNRAEVEAMVRKVSENFGPIDILVNNAGIAIMGDLFSIKDPELSEMFDVNVRGVINCTQLVAGSMKDRQYGKVVNVASIAGIGTNFVGTTAYASTKASVMTLTKRSALELGPFGINVNAVAPGYIQTDINIRGKSAEEWERSKTTMSEKAMLRRIGQPEDIARVILFLASDESSFITGQTLVVDGGRLDYVTHSL